MPRWKWILTQMTRQLWLRATLIGSVGILAAILAAFAERFIPWELPGNIRTDAVDSILNILAASMLTVTSFSVSVMVSAYGSATSNVTPRATKLLIEDRTTQVVLSTFLGSFLFSIVGIVVLRTGAYGDRGRIILFFVTIGVIALIVISLLRWIDHLTRLGRVGETTDRVEKAAKQAIEARLASPYLGGVPLQDPNTDNPLGAIPITSNIIGYVQHIDMGALSRCADELDFDIFVPLNPGSFVYADTPLAYIGLMQTELPEDDEWQQDIREAFSIGAERSFDQDPRFGLVVMSEIASRALSPAVNDSGTAIDVIGRSTRLLSLWGKGSDEQPDPEHPRIHVPPLKSRDLFEDAFMLLARDGASMIEVQLRIQKSLRALSRMGDGEFRTAALTQARLALQRADEHLKLDADKERLREDIQG